MPTPPNPRHAAHTTLVALVAAACLAPAWARAQSAPDGPPASSDATPATPAHGPAARSLPAAAGAAAAPVKPHGASQSPARARRANTGIAVHFGIPGEWQLRAAVFSTFPLETTPGFATPATLGQNVDVENWFRLTPELAIGDRFRFVVQLDILRGSLPIQTTRQVELSRDSRDTQLSPFPHGFALGTIDLRWAYIDWTTPIGVIRAGQQGSHWGYGMVANDGNHAPLFGDYRLGDIVERVAFATRPGGPRSDLVVAVAGDLVYRDRLASLMTYDVPVELAQADGAAVATRTLGGDVAWQGLATVFWQDHRCTTDCERQRVGLYAAYRGQSTPYPSASRATEWDHLEVGVVDLYARWEWPTPDGVAKVFAGTELAAIFGRTNIARTATQPEQGVLQYGGVAEWGVERRDHYRLTVSGGYASGDSNPTDGTLRAFTFNPDYRVGLILFPELMNWQTARAASILADPRIMGRAAAGTALLASSGGVTNAAFLNPTLKVNPLPWLDLRAGVVVAVATSDLVDPVQVELNGSPRNYRGGDSRARDLGVELDLGLNARHELSAGVVLNGGVQGGVLFPGHAFDDGSGRGLGPLGLVMARAGLTF